LTHSVYAKAGTGIPSVYFFSNDGGLRLAKFNLLTGEYIGHSGEQNYIPFDRYSIEDVGNDWYRIAVTILEPRWEGSKNYSVGLSQDTDDTIEESSSGTDFCYLWGAQLEQRDSVTAYTPTNGNPITKYQPQLMFASPDQPRFDHDVLTGESKGLLIEESRTNLIEYSEDFGTWTKTGAIDVDSQGTIGLDNKSFASKITRKQTGSTGDQNIYISKALGNTNKHSISLYVKPVSNCDLVLNTGSYAARFDFSSLTVTDLKNNGLFDGGQIESLDNGWYRCSANGTGESSSVQYQIIPWIGSVGGDWSNDRYHDGDSVSGLYIWGAQLEEGSFPTSYIKTSGASATRSADNASITGENFSSWYRQDEGSLYCEAAKRDVSYSVIPVSVDGGSSDYIFLNLRSTESFEIKKNNSYQVSSLGFSNVDAETYHKIIGAYKKDNSAVSLNGIDALTDTDCEIPAINRLVIGSISGAAQNCHIKKISYYPQRLTNEQLQQLTK